MRYLKSALAISLFFLLLTGCNTFGVGVQAPGTTYTKAKHKKQGPPPHAPAHGYRHKYKDGHDLRYDSDIGAYVAVNIPGTYFGNNLYIRMSSDGKWLVSTSINGGWRIAASNEVPYKLKEKKKKKKHKKDKHKKKKKYYYE
jgi:hypothetical protein